MNVNNPRFSGLKSLNNHRAWELSNGIDVRPLVPLKQEESVAEHIALPFASASMELLLTAVDNLLSRAYARPGMQGRYAGGVVMECVLYRAQPWRKEFRFKQAVGDWRQVSRIVRGRLESDHPQGPGGGADVGVVGHHRGIWNAVEPAGRRAGRPGAAAGRGGTPVAGLDGWQTRPVPVAQVAPWHPAPEMQAMRVPVEPSGTSEMRPLSLPSPVAVQEGPEGEPAAVLLGERWPPEVSHDHRQDAGARQPLPAARPART